MSLIKRPFSRPYPITQSFGPTNNTYEPALYGYLHFHTGVDYALPSGTPVLASFDGVVEVPAYDPHGYGNYVVLVGSDGLRSYMCHLSKVSVHAGQRVKQGQMVGLSGNTGNSTGPHLHWGLEYAGMYTHPWPWVAEAV